MPSPFTRRHGFTLVELLVVIGIIGALIAILLPVLSGVSARGRDIKCQSNVRQIAQLLLAYASENKGSLPYGWYPMNWDWTGTDNPTSSIGDDFVSWASIITRMSRKGAAGEDGFISSPFNGPFLKCPEAAMVENQLVTYVVNLAAMPGPFDDMVTMGAQPPQSARHKPAITSRLFPHTILVHDTAVGARSDESVGYLTNADVDGQRIWQGAITPQFRYFDSSDPYAQFPPGIYGNNRPVILNVGSRVWRNIDPGTSPPGIPYQGNLRFRHQKETACNAGFGDGHVEALVGKFNRDKTLKSHTALRRMFLPKWPAGIPRDESVP